MRQPHAIFKIFLPFAFGYFLSYLYRTVNAVIAPDLVADFGLDADQLGLLTGAYFLTFGCAQLPLGVILDRFGAKRTEAVLLVFAAVGAAVFAAAQSFSSLFIGRALIGLGVSACLMASFRAYRTWFPAQRLPLANGCTLAAGGLGALAATTPVEWALGWMDWRGVFVVTALLTLVVIAVLLSVVPSDPRPLVRESWAASFAGVGRVFRSAFFWRVAPLTVPAQASFLSIQGLWTGPWLADVAALPRAEASQVLFGIAAAMAMGFASAGWIAERLGRVGVPLITTAVAGTIVFIIIQALIIWRPVDAVPWLWIAFGLSGAATTLPYAVLSQRFPASLSGRVTTGVNLLIFAIAFALQWGIGAIIRAFPPAPGGGYAPLGYDVAFLTALGFQLAGLIWCLAFRRDAVPAG
jgi:predicted MFS family arabinose efflux permease